MGSQSIQPIRTEAEHQAALNRIRELMDAETSISAEESIELDVLVDLVELYEYKYVPLEHLDPVSAIECRMEQGKLSPRDLIPIFGSKAKLSEVLSRKCLITAPMARALSEHLGIPSDILLYEPDLEIDNPDCDVLWHRFPLKTMAKRGWIADGARLLDQAETIVRDLIARTGVSADMAQFHKSVHMRANSKLDPYALKAWCWQVLVEASKKPLLESYTQGTVTEDFLREVGQLSRFEDGPRKAREFLYDHGISLVILRHLPKTYLDGAALQGRDGQPVVSLTLRYDRIDNFWFCLLHELAHVGWHLGAGNSNTFVDDLTLRSLAQTHEDPREREADKLAEEALIPEEVWQSVQLEYSALSRTVKNLADRLKIHPAIVAGRVRYVSENYRLLPQFVGNGKIRPQLETDLES